MGSEVEKPQHINPADAPVEALEAVAEGGAPKTLLLLQYLSSESNIMSRTS